MRPMAGDNAFGRPRTVATHDDDALHPSIPSASSSHMSFVFADEASVDSYIDHSQSSARPLFREHRKHHDPTPALGQFAKRDDKDRGKHSRPASRHRLDIDAAIAPAPCSPVSRHSVFTCSPASFSTQNHLELSRPITPIMLGPSVSGSSAISSPSSRRHSLGGSISEHALSDDEEQAGPGDRDVSTLVDSGSAPQLVMPSIQMPSRRPFTDTGRSLARLKIFLAGDSGTGKTSLIKAITQCCQHLVHVDPMPSQSQSGRRQSTSAVLDRLGPTGDITEILASTKPYPEWWAELDGNASGRRKSLGDGILDRNICFVDTPGYSRGPSAMETIVPCVEYVESHLNKMVSDSLSDSDLLNVLGGTGGFQTDVVIYMITQKLKPADLEYMRRLTRLTNVVPVLARVDTLSSQEILSCKEQITNQLLDAGIRTFSFKQTLDYHGARADIPVTPYAVSSAKGSDHHVMDASLLMSPDYTQPLVATELSYLVDKLFSVDGISWLRHAAARKYIDWKNSDIPRPRHLYTPLTAPGPSLSNALVRFSRDPLSLNRVLRPHDTSLPNLSEDSRLYVADWAADLQRSLSAEKDQRYQLPVQADCLVRRPCTLDETKREGAMVLMQAAKGQGGTQSRKVGSNSRLKQKGSRRTRVHQDPLGLLQVSADLKATSWVALELLGSLGIIGGLAFWLSRQHWHSEPTLVVDDWARLWGLDF